MSQDRPGLKPMRDRKRVCRTCTYCARQRDGSYVCVHASVFSVTAPFVPTMLHKRACEYWELIEEDT